MTSPQLDDGYTRLANELFDAILIAGLSGRQLLVVMAIIRKTYGYNKKEDDIGLSQIVSATGIDKAHVSRALKDLEAMNIITRRNGKYGHILGVNKNYKSWVAKRATVAESATVAKRATGGCQKSNKGVAESATLGLPKEQPQKTTPKDNQKTTPKDNTPPAFNPLSHLAGLGVRESIAKDWLALRKNKKATVTETAINGILREATKAGWTMEAAISECCSRGWGGFKAEWVTPPSMASPTRKTAQEKQEETIAILTGRHREQPYRNTERDITAEIQRIT